MTSRRLRRSKACATFCARSTCRFRKARVLQPVAVQHGAWRVKGTDSETLVNEVVLRSQAQAEYSAENYGHFGLALRRYAHFTSPIRRYADLIVHRGLDPRAETRRRRPARRRRYRTSLNEISARISAAERRAMAAERETVDRLIAHHLADRIGASFEGRIGGVTRAGCSSSLTKPAPTDSFRPAPSATTISSITRTATR